MLSNKTFCSCEDMVVLFCIPTIKVLISAWYCLLSLAIVASFRVMIQKFGEHINVNGKLFLFWFKKGSWDFLGPKVMTYTYIFWLYPQCPTKRPNQFIKNTLPWLGADTIFSLSLSPPPKENDYAETLLRLWKLSDWNFLNLQLPELDILCLLCSYHGESISSKKV